MVFLKPCYIEISYMFFKLRLAETAQLVDAFPSHFQLNKTLVKFQKYKKKSEEEELVPLKKYPMFRCFEYVYKPLIQDELSLKFFQQFEIEVNKVCYLIVFIPFEHNLIVRFVFIDILHKRKNWVLRSNDSFLGKIPQNKEKLVKIANYSIDIKIRFLICLGFLG